MDDKMSRTRFVLILIIILIIITGILGCSVTKPMPHQIEFGNAPCIKPYKEYNYLVCQQIEVMVDDAIITVPKEFETDLASIPRPFWAFVSPNQSNLIAPTILHDYLYTCHNNFERLEVDEILYNSLLENGVSNFRAYTFYLGVRLFGWPHYHTDVSCETQPGVIADSDANVDGDFLNCQDVFNGDASFL